MLIFIYILLNNDLSDRMDGLFIFTINEIYLSLNRQMDYFDDRVRRQISIVFQFARGLTFLRNEDDRHSFASKNLTMTNYK